MKIRYSKTKDNLIALVAATILAVTLVGGYQHLGYRYPWLDSTEAPAPDFRRELRAYA